MPSDPPVRARFRMVMLRIEQDLFPLAGFILVGKGYVKTALNTLTEHLIHSPNLGPSARALLLGPA